MSSAHAIESNTIGNDAQIHQGNVIHNYASAPREPCVLIPFLRNEELIHRQDIITELNRILPLSDDYSTAALYGLGGSGKTQIALDYAYRRCQISSCSVFWVHADNETTFMQDFKSIAKKLGLSTNLDGEDFLTAVRYGIESNPPWVLILDNADNLGLFGVNHTGQDALNQVEHVLSLDKFIPRGPRGQVLWTSRDERIAGGIVAAHRAIKVPKMTPNEAKELFESVRNSQGKSDEIKDEYVLKLRDGKKRWRILKQSQSDRHRRREVSNSILETWNISMKYLQIENKTAYQILHIHAFLDNQKIPAELIKQAALYDDDINDIDHIYESCSDGSSSVSENDDDKVTEAIARLCDFSFLSIQATGDGNRAFKMHKLVQEAMRYGLSRKERKKEEEYFSVAALEIISGLFPASREPEACEWVTLCGREIMVSDLLARLTRHLFDRGRWRECEITEQRAYKLRKATLGDNHIKSITSMADLATIYYHLGRWKDGEELMVKSLRLQQEILGNKLWHTLRCKSVLATIYHYCSRYEEAKKLMLETLPLQQETLGSKHRHTLDSMDTLASIYSSLGEYEKAEELIFGQRHPNTMSCSGTLAGIYYDSGRYEEAEETTIECLSLCREIYGHKYPGTIWCMAMLANIYEWLGRGEEAEELAKEALTLGREVRGDKHPSTITLMALLGNIYHKTGRYKEAGEMRAKTLELHREAFG
ncbi:P-loop containing nucleoside triphosphate hydrolase protein [Trichoderma velutinum]